MAGIPPDPAAMDAKLDRILGQLTTMNNRLNSHDARLTRVETGTPHAGKSSGEDNTNGGGDAHRDDRDDHDGRDFDRDRAWASSAIGLFAIASDSWTRAIVLVIASRVATTTTTMRAAPTVTSRAALTVRTHAAMTTTTGATAAHVPSTASVVILMAAGNPIAHLRSRSTPSTANQIL